MEKGKINPNKDNFLVGTEGDVTYVASQTSAASEGTKLSAPITDTQKLEFGSRKVVPWGEDNTFPQDLIEIGKKSVAVPSTIEKITGLIYGGGVVFGNIHEDDHGNEYFKTLDDANLRSQIRTALRKFNIDAFVKGAALDLAWFGYFFPEITSIDGKFAGAWRQPARKVRWVVPKEKTAEVNEAYIYSNWEDEPGPEILKQKGLKRSVIDQENYAPEELIKKHFKDNKGKKANFIYKLMVPSVDCDWYNIPIWYSAVESKWLDYSIEIPKLKHNALKNQLTIKYIIYVDPQYWTIRFGEKEWNKLSPKERQEKKKKVASEFLTHMQSDDGKNGTLMLEKVFDSVAKQEYKLWTVEQFNEPIKSGELILDNSEAMNNVAHAFAIDPTIVGFSSGKNHTTSGSGSDKRVATNVQTSLMRYYQDLILKASCDIMRDVNGLDPNIVFRMRNNIQLTLDQGKSNQESK